MNQLRTKVIIACLGLIALGIIIGSFVLPPINPKYTNRYIYSSVEVGNITISSTENKLEDWHSLEELSAFISRYPKPLPYRYILLPSYDFSPVVPKVLGFIPTTYCGERAYMLQQEAQEIGKILMPAIIGPEGYKEAFGHDDWFYGTDYHMIVAARIGYEVWLIEPFNMNIVKFGRIASSLEG